jgi:zinc protease
MMFLYKYKFVILVALITMMSFFVVLTKFYFERDIVPSFRSKIDFTIPTDNVKKITLKNGMNVLLFKNTAVPKVLMQIAYNVGSYVEQAGERGLAHLIEHMIFKGTEKLSETDIDEISRKYGASFNAFTSHDITSYYFEVDKNNWKPFIGILADCMQNARFSEQHLSSELRTVIQELKMYKDDFWDSMINKSCELLYPSYYPYHHPIIGYKTDLMAVSSEQLRNFYKKYYDPKIATLFVVGDFEPEEIIEDIKREFEEIPSSKDLNIKPFPHLPTNLISHHTKTYEDVKTEQLCFYWQIPGFSSEDEIVSSAASFMLGEGEGSRLHKALVDNQKVASSIRVASYKFQESGLFLILIEPVAGKKDECKKVIQEELIKASKEGFTDKELEHMTRAKGKHFFQKLQRAQDFTYEWLVSFYATGDEYSIFDRANKFAKIDLQDIQDFIDGYLDPILMNQIEVLPMPASKKEMWKHERELSDEMDNKILSSHNRTEPIEPPKFANQVPSPKPLDFTFPKPDKQFTLDNGLKVLLKQNRTFPIISLSCKFKEYFHFSASDEGIIMQLMMDMLIEESKDMSKEEIVDFFEQYGADYAYNAEGARLSILSPDSKYLFKHFLKILQNPTFPQSALEKLRAITIDSLVRGKDDPADLAVRTLKTEIYKNHPFGWSFDDAISIVKKATTSDLANIHKKVVSPANMILTVVGDFDTEAMTKQIKEIFGGWQGVSEQKVEYPEISFNPGQTIDKQMLRDQVVLLMGQPSNINIYHPDMVPIKLINYIAFFSLGSRLYKLRERTGLFYAAFGCWASGAGKEVGFDYVGAILSPDKAGHAQTQIKSLIKELSENGVSDEEIASARQLYLKTLIDAISTNGSLASIFGTLEAFQLGFDYYDKVLQRIQTIGTAELNNICTKYFSTNKMTTIRAGRIG